MHSCFSARNSYLGNINQFFGYLGGKEGASNMQQRYVMVLDTDEIYCQCVCRELVVAGMIPLVFSGIQQLCPFVGITINDKSQREVNLRQVMMILLGDVRGQYQLPELVRSFVKSGVVVIGMSEDPAIQYRMQELGAALCVSRKAVLDGIHALIAA